MQKQLKILLIIVLALVPIFMSTYLYAFNESFYAKAFVKHGVDKALPETDLNEYNHQVLQYLKGKQDAMPTTLPLTEKEIQHMKDVQGVFSLFFVLFWIVDVLILVLIFTIYYKSRENYKVILKSSFFFAGLYSLIAFVVLAVSFALFFNSAFSFFHKIFFEGDSWLFPPGSTLITLYPTGLFFDIFLKVLLTTLVISMLFILIGRQKRYKKKQTEDAI